MIDGFIRPIFQKLDLKFCGLDIIIGRDGKMYLLEVNTQIGFFHLVKDNGEDVLINIYKKVLNSIWNIYGTQIFWRP